MIKLIKENEDLSINYLDYLIFTLFKDMQPNHQNQIVSVSIKDIIQKIIYILKMKVKANSILLQTLTQLKNLTETGFLTKRCFRRGYVCKHKRH